MSAVPPEFDRAMLAFNELASDILLMRRRLLSPLLDKAGRNIDKECGYEENEPSLDQYHKMYDREGIATRVVNVWPDETWSVAPELYETENPNRTTRFERAWADLEERHNLWSELHKLDRIAGVGNYGVLLLGIGDGRPLNQAVEGVTEDGKVESTPPARELLYTQVLPQKYATVSKLNSDPNSPRYNQPQEYSVEFSNPEVVAGGDAGGIGTRTGVVHWSRVIHFADNGSSSKVWGVPRLRPVYNRVLDIRKVLGGAAEGFWGASSPKYSVEALPDANADEVRVNKASVVKEFDAFFNHVQKILVMNGMTVKPLSPTMPDPVHYVDVQMQNLAASIDVAVPVLMGFQQGHLAGQQDTISHNRKVGRRQRVTVNPYLIRPLADRLMTAGCLPTVKKYAIGWRDLNALTEKDMADVAVKRIQAVLQYCTSGAEMVLPKLEFWTDIMGLSPEKAKELVKASEALKTYTTEKVWKKPAAAGADSSGNVSKRPARNSSTLAK